jgi:hypothetical protein
MSDCPGDIRFEERVMKSLRWGGLMLAAMVAVQGSGTAFGQAITGDLDGNHEVSLSDVTDFVECLSGPDAPSLDPTCDAALFDEDDDVDLRDVAGFQSRFGFGVGPPRIDRFWPPPGEWIVDDVGLTEMRVGFTEPVSVPDGSIDVWVVSRLQVDGGDVTGFTTDYDPDDFLLTVTFAEPLRDDRVTIVVDYLIEDLAGNPLDGEIYNPHNAVLPSGNGVNGGQGVFRIHVLQGDANRDGVVDDADLELINASLGLCSNDPGFDPLADLNTDGCVDEQDEAIAFAAVGRELPATDGQPPSVSSVSIDGKASQVETVEIRFSEPYMVRPTLRVCFLVDPDGNVIIPFFVIASGFGNRVDCVFEPAIPSCDGLTINFGNSMSDWSGELLSSPLSEPCK